MSRLDSMPIATAQAASGLVAAQTNTYLGVDSRPQLLTDLYTDTTYQNAVHAALAQPQTGGTTLSVPVSAKDMQDSMQAINPRQVAPMQFPSSRVPYTVNQVEQAAIDSRVFGSGWVDTFRKDKPPQGIQYLRPTYNVPVDLNSTWNQPTVGPWNPINVNATAMK